MIELADASPDVHVNEDEYIRLLGYPRHWVLEDRARELADWAKDWYTEHGRPWVYAHEVESVEVAGTKVRLNGVEFRSQHLSSRLAASGGHGAVIVAVGAGPELEVEAQRLWQEGKPDEYFFLEVYGSAVVEHLVMMTGARLCAWADGRAEAVLPHDSPGYPGWAIDDQPRLLEIVNASRPPLPPVPVGVLESGMLRPKKSLLAVFGLTRHLDRVARLTDLIPCENCSFLACQYRRRPYRRGPTSTDPELDGLRAANEREADGTASPLAVNAAYTVNMRALKRWTAERLSLERRTDGSVDALFRYEGTTCTNMGRRLEFHYQVSLGPRAEGYPIRGQHCRPMAADDGYTYMCRYLSDGDQLLSSIDADPPLRGRPLDDVLSWKRPVSAAGCYCHPESRDHKWGLVLETIHYALANSQD